MQESARSPSFLRMAVAATKAMAKFVGSRYRAGSAGAVQMTGIECVARAAGPAGSISPKAVAAAMAS